MSTGVRTELVVEDPALCQVAKVSDDAGEVTAVSRSTVGAGDDVVEEFTLNEGDGPADVDAEALFSHESGTVYRIEREPRQGCICERIEAHGCPVRDLRSTDGRLHVTFIADDVVTLRAVVRDLKSAADGVHVRRLTRSSDAGQTDRDLVYLDRSALTDRQREVLETAHRMGYFAHPKEANAGEVAEALDVTRSTFTEHLAAAQRKVLETLVES